MSEIKNMLSDTETHFPFSALEGQQALKTALLLSAIEPLIGGVLIEGPRGTAKSTAARGLADLLNGATLVNLPLSASEEQLLGSLNIENALRDGQVNFKPGLLSAAHKGVLYVDEVNLLTDHLVDALLDVSSSGVNRIERDGISHQHAARFVLIGTMNPEEGQLRPQLLDRFGLYVQLPENIEPEVRQRIVQARLAFDSDSSAFIKQFEPRQKALKQRLQQAREQIKRIELTETVMKKVTVICHKANVEGVRADLTLLRAARAHAAWQGRTKIIDEDIKVVQQWVLTHRQKEFTPASDLNNRETQHPSQTEQPEIGSEENSTQAIENSENDDWGAMPPQTPGIAPIKSLQPFMLKK